MRYAIAAMTILCGLSVAPAIAAPGNCASSTPADFIAQNAFRNLLTTRYAFGTTLVPAPDSWDELHPTGTTGGGTFISGGKTLNWTTTSGGGAPDTISYVYGPTATYTYKVTPVAGTTPPNTGTYLFCMTGNTAGTGLFDYTIKICTSPGGLGGC